MTDPFRNYDAWLERPYVEAADRAEEFERAAEYYGLDPEHDEEEILARIQEEREADGEPDFDYDDPYDREVW